MAKKDTFEQLEQAPAIVQETHKLKSLQTGLRTMSMLLKEFEGKEYEPDVADWLKNVRDVANKTQEMINSIVVETNYQNQKCKLGRILSGGRVNKRHVEEIENIEKRIEGICSFKDKWHHEVVGFKDAQESLVGQLIGDAKPECKVILIHGKAGYGKTTLAKMVYEDYLIKTRFDYRRWVSWTQELPLEELISRILKHTNSPSNHPDCLSKDELKARFCEIFKGKRYLVVIDSVRNSDATDELMSSFPDESNGSRILIASRWPQADLRVQQRFSFLYEVKPLDVEQSWQLLSKIALEGGIYADLEELGRRMAEKCKGSPRAIVVLAAILKNTEKTEQMWSKFLEGYDDPLSYDDLPEDLKSCLLFFGLFPEDKRISAKQMIQMWMAEGLLMQNCSKEAQEIGEDYLKILIEKSFIKKHDIRADKSVKTCYAVSNISRICKVHMKTPNPGFLLSTTPIKRMGINIDSVTDVKSFEDCPDSPHSLHCFRENINSTSIRSVDFWEKLLHKFRHLQVLNLGFLELDKVPKVLGKLTNLSYLRLRAPNAKHLPSSIVNLHKLETLDMRESPLVSLPHGIWKMQLLRHLYLKGSTSLPKTSNIDYYRSLPNLQTLSGVNSDKILRWLMVRAKFPNVKKLRICSLDSELTYKYLNSLDLLYHLQSLRVEKSTKLPNLNAFPLSLTKLTLLETELRQESIKTLEELPNLRILKLLHKAISGQEFACSEGGFMQLEVLYMKELDVSKWTLGEGAMQCVKRFLLKKCERYVLESAPDFLKKVAVLKDEENGIQ